MADTEIIGVKAPGDHGPSTDMVNGCEIKVRFPPVILKTRRALQKHG